MERALIFLIDVAFATLVLRLILGWLLIYPRLVKMLAVLLVIALIAVSVDYLELPFSGILSLVLILPITVMLILSFLPELGRIYQSASRGAFFRPKLMNSREIVPDLVECLEQLRKKRIGALLVFPGAQRVDDFISGGEEVDAKVNRSLILSIFNPNAPRHDGAIVIRNNRVVHIGGVLPLASADDAASHYGTRHLAALGLTERCDADVLIVSEERGVISHARDGDLEILPDSDPKELTRILNGIIEQGPMESRKRQSQILVLGLWVMALGISVIGSLQVTNIKERIMEENQAAPLVVKSIEAPIQFTNRPPGTFIVGPDNGRPRILVNVPDSVSMADSAPIIQIDLKNVPMGETDLSLQASMVRGLPSEATVERFEPASIRYRVEEEQKLKIRISRPETFGLIPELRIRSLEYEPKEVDATVRDADWKNSNTLKVLPVDLSTVTEPGEITLTAELNLPASINLETEKKIQVILDIVEK